MDARAIAFAVPVFFVLIALEYLLTRKRKEPLYRYHDAISSLSCGIGQQVLGLFFFAFRVGIYTWVYEHAHVMTISTSSIPAWVVLFVAVDFAYYLYHWASHRISFFWATHAVHHQSEEYNLSTALRQSWFTALSAWIFYLPLAIIGFPPLMLVATQTMNTLYQFWIHTRAVGKLGLLEAFLNTPSHHRVHHGTDPVYIDKNYAGVFIIWDRLFGTFELEAQEPVYGTVKPLSSFNPGWANIEPWVNLVRTASRTRRLRDKLLLFVMPPDWRPADLGGPLTIPETSRASQQRYDVRAPMGLNLYVALSFVLATIATTALLFWQGSLSSGLRALSAAAIVLTLLSWGALFEAKSWAVPFEWARLTFVVALTAWFARGTDFAIMAQAGAVVAALFLSLWVARYRARGVKLSTVGGSDLSEYTL